MGQRGDRGRSCCGCCSCCECTPRKALYVTGLGILLFGTVCCLVGFFDTSWVFREGGSQLTVDTVDHYGLWMSCSPQQLTVQQCRHIFDAMPGVEDAARGSQALITLAIIVYAVCTGVELISCCPFGLKAKMSTIFENRVVEYLIAVATVVGFLGLLTFAGEVKNKATRDIGQVDFTGSGFTWYLTGQLLVVLGCCLLACGRPINTTPEKTTS